MARTFILTERRGAFCRLSPEDVEFLLAGHRAHVHVGPAGQRGVYRLTPTGHVGTLVAPGCRLVIRPKVPLANLFHLLDPAGPVPVTEDQTATRTGTEVLDFLAGRLARLLAERAAAGLHRAYAERAEAGPFLQGRLDLAAHLRGDGRKDRLHCRYDDFTADIPCNQFPRATAELVLRSPLVSGTVRAAVRRSLAGFAEVRSVPVDPKRLPVVTADRLTESYRPLLSLCLLLAQGLAPGTTSGPASCPAFLLDMERVFEAYVTQGVEESFKGTGGYAVAVQPLLAANRPVPGQVDLPIRPDVVVEYDSRPACVVDAKWKKGAGTADGAGDLYQVIAYATALGARRAVLVYPGRRDGVRTYQLAAAPLRLDVHTVRVIGSREACRRSLRRFGRALRRTPAAQD